MLKATILIDNIADGALLSEWGFCAHIEYRGKNYLLDTGASDRYAANARELDIKLSDVDTAVLSHAHFDHSDGMEAFSASMKPLPSICSGRQRRTATAGSSFSAATSASKRACSPAAQSVSAMWTAAQSFARA